MKTLLMLIPLLGIVGCGTQGTTALELGTGYNTSFGNNDAHDWNNGGSPAFYGSLRREYQREGYSVVWQYMHVSQLFTGWPLNNDVESSLDHVGVAIRYKLSE